MEGLDRLQRENCHVPSLYLLGSLHVNELRLLKGRVVSPIAEFSFLHAPLHGGGVGSMDALLLVASPALGNLALLCKSETKTPLPPEPLGYSLTYLVLVRSRIGGSVGCLRRGKA